MFNASFTNSFVRYFLCSFNCSISAIVLFSESQLFSIRLTALYGLSILPAAFSLGQIVNQNTSASKSSFNLSSISFFIHLLLDFLICFNHSCTIILFSQVSLIQSATVHIAAISIDSSIYSFASFSGKYS
ncbi:MAG: hypothetical protein Q8S84_02280 [bacterium]|nr:hypothetical protein [bacterium]MDP3380380.1 hypothetical protein [bacterium]